MTSPRPHVPHPDVIAAMGDDELAVFAAALENAIADCDEVVDTHPNPEGVRSARRVYANGLRIADSLQRARCGEPPQRFTTAKPIHDWVSAYTSVKAALRLIGLVEAEHRAIDHWLEVDEDGEDGAYNLLLAAHSNTKTALVALEETP